MLLFNLIKIIFLLWVIRHIIKWVRYHIHHRNKKTRVFHGNCRMPFDVEFALMYGINALTKTRFKGKDLSYRKSLVQWWLVINSNYPDDSKVNSPPRNHINSTLVNGNRKQFPQLKTRNNNSSQNVIPLLLSRRGQSYAGSWGGFCTLNKTCDINTKIISFNNLKIPQNTIPFPKQIFACTA